ncbi:TcdA/TcdB pore-forming domain-containing protein [Burkholderia gladioli]|uniref:TcdA/TcdB pore-forming domain-containing protein n=1 Tax=Burkholderia gladioli TaxID=28095 RepID=UPI003B9880A1
MKRATENDAQPEYLRSLTTDPISFVNKYTLSVHNMTESAVLAVPDSGFARLVARENDVFEVRCDFSHNDILGRRLPAYFLGYNAGAQSSNTPAWVDIPIEAESGSLMFTGTLTGCTVIVTKLDDKTYRVFHDSRLNSAGLYENVVMATNYMDYRLPRSEVGIAAAFLHHNGRNWRLITQRQQLEAAGSTSMLPERIRGDSVVVMAPDADYGSKFRSAFDTVRRTAHRELAHVAKELGEEFMIPEDDPYTPGSGFSPNAESFAEWTKRVDDLKRKLDEKIEKNEKNISMDPNSQESKKIRIANTNIKKNLANVTESVMDVERTWLWRRIREIDGQRAVVDLNGPKRQIDDTRLTAGERYAYRYEELAQDSVFKQGWEEYKQIKLSDSVLGMSLLDKKSAFLNMTDMRQLGALSRVIAEIEDKSIANSLENAGALSKPLAKPGATIKLPMPQGLFLGRIQDAAPGRCYPLVRAMAVALAQRGEAGARILVEKMYVAAASAESPNTELLSKALMQLHGDKGARQASGEPRRFDIGQIIDTVKSGTSTRVFAVNTALHAMLVGCVVADQSTFYFYDPNVGMFGYPSAEILEKALRAHLENADLAEEYKPFGSASKPTFDFVEIKSNLMAQVQLNKGLNVADLSDSGELTEIVKRRGVLDTAERRLSTVSADLRLQSALKVTEARRLGQRFYDAVHRLIVQAGLSGRWMPVISTIRSTDEHTNEIQLIDLREPHTERWLESRDDCVSDFKAFVDEHSGEIGRQFTMDPDRIVPVSDRHSDGEPIHGLNAGFAIQTLIDWFGKQERDYVEESGEPPALALALTVHSYLNLVQISHGAIDDVIKLTGIVRALMQEQPVANGMALGAFSKAFSHAFDALGLGAGVMVVGLDIFELAQAENAAQRGVFGTQLAFDSASLVAGVGGTVAGMLGASTASAMLGGAGAILGGLAVGFTGLARALGDVAEQVLKVGLYFSAVQTAYRSGGYELAVQNGTYILTPLPGAVVCRIDMPGKRIGFDTQYIYRTRHGSTGSGRDNYFVWAGDFPTMVHDRSQAIDIRSGIGCDAAANFDYPKARVLILPATPKSYIAYNYGPFPGVTTRHDEGFDVLRKLEQDYRFDFDFYIFPGEQAVNVLHQEFVETPVDIELDDRGMTLVTPILPEASQGFLHYRIVGAGAQYTVVLNAGSRVTLSGKPSETKSRFVISTDLIQTASQIQVHADRIDCGAVSVTVNRQFIESMHIVTATRAVLKVDFDTQQAAIVSEDASGWVDADVSFKAHLAQQAKDNLMIGRTIAIENYQLDGKNMGRAYYDSERDRILYTNSDWQVLHTGQLIGVSRDAAYFVNDAKTTIWCSDIETGTVLRWFAPWFYRGPDDLHRVWQEQDGIYIQCQYDWMWKGLLTYRIDLETNRLTLISAAGDDELLKQLARAAHLDAPVHITKLLYAYGDTRGRWFIGAGGELVTPVAADIVMIFGQDNDGMAHRYWLRTATGVLVKPNLGVSIGYADAGGHSIASRRGDSNNSMEVQSLALQAPRRSSGTHSAEPIPEDLTLLGWRTQGLKGGYFYFYSHKLKTLFGQSGPGQEVLDAGHPTAVALDTGPLASVVSDRGAIILVRQDGRVLEIADDRSFQTVAVNEHWLAAQTCWWDAISQAFDKRSVFAIFGLTHGSSSRALQAWVCKGDVIVASPMLREPVVQLLDVESGQASVFCPEAQTLYLQAGMSQADLRRGFGNGTHLNVETVPPAIPVDLGVKVEKVEVIRSGLRLTTPEGLVYTRNTQGALRLVGVTRAWWHAQAKPEAALAEKAARMSANGVMTIYGGTAKAWFDLELSRFYEGAQLDADAAGDAEFIGASIDGQTGYVYSRSQLTVYELNYLPRPYKMGDVRRIDTSVAAQPPGDTDIMPMLYKQNTLVLAGGKQAHKWDLYGCWHTGGTVVVCADDAGSVTLVLYGDLRPYLVSRYRDDLWVFDPETWSTLIVSRAFADKNSPRVTLRSVSDDLVDRPVDELVKDYRRRAAGRTELISIGSIEAVPRD